MSTNNKGIHFVPQVSQLLQGPCLSRPLQGSRTLPGWAAPGQSETTVQADEDRKGKQNGGSAVGFCHAPFRTLHLSSLCLSSQPPDGFFLGDSAHLSSRISTWSHFQACYYFFKIITTHSWSRGLYDPVVAAGSWSDVSILCVPDHIHDCVLDIGSEKLIAGITCSPNDTSSLQR